MTSETKCDKVWHSVEGPLRHQYYVSGTFNSWKYAEMSPDPAEVGVFRYQFAVENTTVLSFQPLEVSFNIVIDMDPACSLYPEAEDTSNHLHLVQGPGSPGPTNRSWRITCLKPGATCEIVLNMRSHDRRRLVVWRWLTSA